LVLLLRHGAQDLEGAVHGAALMRVVFGIDRHKAGMD
jgi:hypothetical protein